MLDKNDPRLTAYALGELDEREAQSVEAELEGSQELLDEVEAIRRTSSLLAEHLGSEPCPELTGEQREAIRQESQIVATPPVVPGGVGGGYGRRWLVTSVLVAATLLLAFLIVSGQVPFVDVAQRDEPDALTVMPSEESADEGSSFLEEMTVEQYESDPVDDESVMATTSPVSDPYGSAGGDLDMTHPDIVTEASTPSDIMIGGHGLPRRVTEGETAEPMPGRDESYDESYDIRGRSDAGGGMGFGEEGQRVPRYHSDPFGDEPSELPAATSPAEPTPAPASPFGAYPDGGGRPEPGAGVHPPTSASGPARPTSAEAGSGPFGDEGIDSSRSSAGGGDMAGGREDEVGELRALAEENRAAAQDRQQLVEAEPQIPPVLRKPYEELAQHMAIPEGEESEGDAVVHRQGGEGAESADEPAAGKGGQRDGQGRLTQSGERGKKREPKKSPSSWRRAKATPNASRVMIGDHDDLPLEGMQVNVMVDGFRARVLMDLYYYNNRNQQLEGSFKLRLPDEASLYYFAFGQTTFEYRPMVDSLAAKGFLTAELVRASGTGPQEIFKARSATWRDVKEARVVPREKAAHAYGEVVRRRVDPALVEWSGAGVFNAKVFPLMPNKLHRIVVGYDVNLQQDGDDLVYSLDLPEDLSECKVDLDVSALPGASAEVTPATRPFVSGGRAFYHFDDPADKSIQVRFNEAGTVLLTGGDENTGQYFASRITPELPAGENQAGSSHAVFLVDTSLSSNPDKFNVWLKMLETILDKNRDSIQQFGVLFFNVESHWWKSGYSKNTPKNVRDVLNHATTLSLEGATDLRAALAEANSPQWHPSSEKTPTPDLFLLSDGAVTWGETDINLIAGALKSGNAGTLFAYQTGLTGTAISSLERLARESGGSVFSVTGEREVEAAAVAHRARPWRLLNTSIDDATDLLIAGRPRFVYPGQSLLVVGRGQPQPEAHLHLRRGDEDKVLTIPFDRTVQSELVARTYGQVAVGQLEDLGSTIEDVSIAYARHFRVAGRTCSLLMLESEADYQRFNIKPEDDQFVVKSSPADHLIRRKMDELTQQLEDPKESMKTWLAKMENMPGFKFKVPTALGLVIDRLPREAFVVDVPRLACKQRDREDLPKKYFGLLDQQQLDYDGVTAEAARRFEKQGGPDALKALSSLIELNPGDTILARDVAYSAVEWGLGGQAYPLFRRVALARPYEPQIYLALGHCLSDLGCADLAMIYYEVALGGEWHSRYPDVNRIAGVEYLHLLQRINAGELSTGAPEYAKARLESLSQNVDVDNADMIVTMMWNTDRTDVDLHVLEPSGEECFYKNRNTRTGGRITRDVTEGFGPEMYTLDRAPEGTYKIMANYYGTDTNRTQMRSKVYVTVYEMFGRKQERVTRHTVTLSRGKEKRDIATVVIEK
ncbi:MAG: VWA domain-containing protein [Planctomycetes bacterium]|nr:VWA domain-containing protein [Planctomycetota bacterium]MBL7044340.1 VWA domain-containing protein [Pirellulaceae bacterium]